MKTAVIVTTLIACALLFNACDNKKVTEPDVASLKVADSLLSTMDLGMTWVDSLVNQFIKYGENPLIESFKTDSGISYSYIIDDTTQRDEKVFIAVRIGNSMEDHFATSAWLYLDTVTREAYTLDMVEDTLIPVRW